MKTNENISSLKKGRVSLDCMITRSEKRNFSNRQGHYLDIELTDRSGNVVARKWDNIDDIVNIPVGTVVNITGDVTEYRGQLQVNINRIKPLPERDPVEFLPSYEEEVLDECLVQLENLISEIRTPSFISLYQNLKKSTYYDDFLKAPAAKGFHHNRIGGLLVHSVSVMRLCRNISELYQLSSVSRDLLLTGALFHDIGKIKEYTYSTMIDLSDEGRLLGHITIGIQMLDEIIGDIDIPQDHVTALRHIILSHHGQYEWGSPKMPKTLEAMILHFADNLDSKIEGVSKVQKEARERGMMWTARFDGRPFFCEQITEQTIDRPVEGELF